MVSYMVGKLAPSSTHSTRVLVKYVPGYGVSSCRLLPKRGQSCYVPAPPQSLNGSNTENHNYYIVPNQPEIIGSALHCSIPILRTITSPRYIARRRPACFRPYTDLLSFTTLLLLPLQYSIRKFHENIGVQISPNKCLL